MTAETVPVCPICGDPHQEVHVYPVGWLRVLRWVGRALVNRHHLSNVRRFAWGGVKQETRATFRRLRQRKWRALKCSFNGYLAEPYHWPDGMRRCGSGWTRRRAMRSLRRQGWRG